MTSRNCSLSAWTSRNVPSVDFCELRAASARLRARLTRPVTTNEVIKNEITTTASSEYSTLKLKTGAAKK